jgi:hypothetical protein
MRSEPKPWLVEILNARDGTKIGTIICMYKYLLLLPRIESCGFALRPVATIVPPKRAPFRLRSDEYE